MSLYVLALSIVSTIRHTIISLHIFFTFKPNIENKTLLATYAPWWVCLRSCWPASRRWGWTWSSWPPSCDRPTWTGYRDWSFGQLRYRARFTKGINVNSLLTQSFAFHNEEFFCTTRTLRITIKSTFSLLSLCKTWIFFKECKA